MGYTWHSWTSLVFKHERSRVFTLGGYDRVFPLGELWQCVSAWTWESVNCEWTWDSVYCGWTWDFRGTWVDRSVQCGYVAGCSLWVDLRVLDVYWYLITLQLYTKFMKARNQSLGLTPCSWHTEVANKVYSSQWSIRFPFSIWYRTW